MDNADRAGMSLPPCDSIVPTQLLIDDVSDVLIDNRESRGMSPHRIMEALDVMGKDNCENRELADDISNMTTYLANVPDHFGIKNIRNSPDGIVLQVRILDED